MGGSSSSSASTSTNNQRQVTQDASENQGLAVTGGGDVSVNALDGGAIDSAFDFAQEVAGFALGAISEDNEQQYQNQAELISEVVQAGRSETSDALNKITIYFFGTVALGLAVYYLRGSNA